MKRSSIQRRTPMRNRREGPTQERERHPVALTPATRRGTYTGATAAAQPKHPASQHAGYMAAVRALGYCMHCRRSCAPQFCHRDHGKGMGIKTDVREGWPGCGPGPWGAGCHWLVGTSGNYSREERRALELDLGRRTRAAVEAAGLWPPTLGKWGEA